MLYSTLRSVLSIITLALILGTPCQAKLPPAPPLAPGTDAPDFRAAAWGGGTMHLSDLRGKIVVLDFWASWCGPCNAAMPHLQELLSQYKSDIVVLAVNVWDTPDDATNWIGTHKYTFTFGFDSTGDGTRNSSPTTRAYHVTAIPTTYVIDKNGQIVAGHVVMDETEIVVAIRQLGAKTEAEHAAERNAPKALSTLATMLNAGDSALAGTVAVKSATGSIDINATSLLRPGVDPVDFDTPRHKMILLTKNTLITNGVTGDTETEIALGAHVNVIGVDQGVGKPLTARVVQVYP